MTREIHKSKYAHSIPGINRNDDHVHFTQAERCVTQFGDGLPMPEKLLAEAANAQQCGRHTKLWCETVDAVTESGVREAFKQRDDKIRQWKEHLNKEVDRLAKEIEQLEEGERKVERHKQYFKDLERVSEMTADFRKNIPDKEPNDRIDNLQQEELAITMKAQRDMQDCLRDLKDCKRKLEEARTALMSEVEAKAFTLNMSKRCQHSEPLLSFPYVPADHPVDQLYHPKSEEDWENDIDAKLRNSMALRHEASAARGRTEAAIKDNVSRMADAWHKTSKAIQDTVQQDERTLFNMQNILESLAKDIESTKHRIESLYDDSRVQDQWKTLQLWRLQTLTYRPGPDHIRDAPAKKCEEELGNLEKKKAFVAEGAVHNRSLLERLQEEKERQTLLMDKISKKLFIERENCLGLRRTVSVEGSSLGDYVTAL